MGRRAFLSVLGAAGIGVALAACGSSDGGGASSSASSAASSGGTASAGAGGTITRGKTTSQITTLTNDFFVAFNDGAKQWSSALGLELGTVEDNGNVNDALSQIGNVKTAGGQQIFGTPATEAEAAAIIKACDEAGIYYGSAYTAPPFYTPADAEHWVRFVTPASVKVAEATATALFEAVGGEGTVVHVPGQKGSSADDQRTAGMNLALKNFPNITIVETAPGNWTSEDARKSFANALPSIGDFKGVFAQNDSEATGVIAVLDAQGVTGKVVTGFDGNKQNIEYIAQGKQLTTSATIGGLTSAIVGIAVFDALNGVQFPLPARFVFQGAVMVTEDTAQQFLDSVYGPTLPFDWEKMSQALHPDDWDPQTLLNPIDPATFFEGMTPDQYQLNSAWEQASSEITTVATTYKDAFKSGPLFDYKGTMVA
jgi:ribose transport system substrate-binding protein